MHFKGTAEARFAAQVQRPEAPMKAGVEEAARVSAKPKKQREKQKHHTLTNRTTLFVFFLLQHCNTARSWNAAKAHATL